MKQDDYHRPHHPKIDIESRFNDLLQEKVDDRITELVTFHKRMVKYKDYIFNYLKYPDVPPDNNGSERAIRNIKVKQKITGQFGSFTGAINFAILRTIRDTAIKNGQNVLGALFNVAELKITDLLQILNSSYLCEKKLFC